MRSSSMNQNTDTSLHIQQTITEYESNPFHKGRLHNKLWPWELFFLFTFKSNSLFPISTFTLDLFSAVVISSLFFFFKKINNKGERSQDGRGIGWGDHFLPYKFTKISSECWANLHKTTSECWQRTPGTQKGRPSSSKGGRTKYKRQKERWKS